MGGILRAGATICAIVTGVLVLRSCWNSAAESRAHQELMDNDKVSPSAYTTEDGIKIAASKTWKNDNNIIGTLPNGDIIQYINAKGDDLKLEQVVITNTEGQRSIQPNDLAFAEYQQQYNKFVEGIRLKYGQDRSLRDAEDFRNWMKWMRY